MKRKHWWGIALVIFCLPLLRVLTLSALGGGLHAPLLQSDALGWKLPLVRCGFFFLLWLLVHGFGLCLRGCGMPLVSLMLVPTMYAIHQLFLILSAWIWWSPVTTYGLVMILLAASGLVYFCGRRTALIKHILSGLTVLLAAIIITKSTALELGLFFWAALVAAISVLLGKVLLESYRSGWRRIGLVLTAVMAGLAVAMTLPSAGPIFVPELSEEQQVQEAVFRHVIGEGKGSVYLSLGRQLDPDLALLRCLADLPVAVYGGSRAYTVRTGAWDRLTLERGAWYSIGGIEWLGAGRARVGWSRHHSHRDGRGGTLLLEKTFGRWQVVGESYREWMTKGYRCKY